MLASATYFFQPLSVGDSGTLFFGLAAVAHLVPGDSVFLMRPKSSMPRVAAFLELDSHVFFNQNSVNISNVQLVERVPAASREDLTFEMQKTATGVFHDIPSDMLWQRFTLPPTLAYDLIALLEDGYNSLSQACGDNSCNVGELTQNFACITDCAVYRLDFYYENDRDEDDYFKTPGLLEANLRSTTVVGADTTVISSTTPETIVFQVMTRSARRYDEIDQALSSGQLPGAIRMRSDGSAPPRSHESAIKSPRLIAIWVVLALVLLVIVGAVIKSQLAKRRSVASDEDTDDKEEITEAAAAGPASDDSSVGSGVAKRSKRLDTQSGSVLPAAGGGEIVFPLISSNPRHGQPYTGYMENPLQTAASASPNGSLIPGTSAVLSTGPWPSSSLAISTTGEATLPSSVLLAESLELFDICLALIATGDSRGLARILQSCKMRGQLPALLSAAKRHGSGSQTDGMTLLHHAAQLSQADAVEVLLQHGAQVNVLTDTGRTPLHSAVAFYNGGRGVDVVAALLQAGAAVNIKDGGNCTPLMLAMCTAGAGEIEQLLEAGADFDLYTLEGYGLATLAVQNSNMEALDTLVEHLRKKNHSLLLNQQDAKGWTALHWAAAIGDASAVDILLDAAVVNTSLVTEQGETALHLAAREGDVAATKAILRLDRPCRPWAQLLLLLEAQTLERLTAEDYAISHGHPACAALLHDFALLLAEKMRLQGVAVRVEQDADRSRSGRGGAGAGRADTQQAASAPVLEGTAVLHVPGNTSGTATAGRRVEGTQPSSSGQTGSPDSGVHQSALSHSCSNADSPSTVATSAGSYTSDGPGSRQPEGEKTGRDYMGLGSGSQVPAAEGASVERAGLQAIKVTRQQRESDGVKVGGGDAAEREEEEEGEDEERALEGIKGKLAGGDGQLREKRRLAWRRRAEKQRQRLGSAQALVDRLEMEESMMKQILSALLVERQHLVKFCNDQLAQLPQPVATPSQADWWLKSVGGDDGGAQSPAAGGSPPLSLEKAVVERRDQAPQYSEALVANKLQPGVELTVVNGENLFSATETSQTQTHPTAGCWETHV